MPAALPRPACVSSERRAIAASRRAAASSERQRDWRKDGPRLPPALPSSAAILPRQRLAISCAPARRLPQRRRSALLLIDRRSGAVDASSSSLNAAFGPQFTQDEEHLPSAGCETRVRPDYPHEDSMMHRMAQLDEETQAGLAQGARVASPRPRTAPHGPSLPPSEGSSLGATMILPAMAAGGKSQRKSKAPPALGAVQSSVAVSAP